MAYDVFISYSTKDRLATEAVCAQLEAEKIRCWMAPRNIVVGKDWAESIIEALNSCKVMVLIFSSNANASPQVTREVQRAFEKGLVVFPFRVENVQPTPGLEYYLGSVHWLDALTEPLEEHIAHLAIQVKAILEGTAVAIPPSRPDSKLKPGAAPLPGANSGGPPRQSAPRQRTAPVLTVAGAVLLLAAGGIAFFVRDHGGKESARPETASLPHPSPTAAQTGNGEPEPAETPVAQAAPAPAKAAAPAAATQEKPWENSLGMDFVPIPGVKALFSIWNTRVQDYEQFAKETGRVWKTPNFEQGPTHPAVNLSWTDAKDFCAWLTEKERNAGIISADQSYRLPTDAEWSLAVGLPKEEGRTPAEKDGKIKGVYPWGVQWPPPKEAGNYGAALAADSYKETSPVGSFAPNKYGLYDMGGNVWQWCEDIDGDYRAVRGGSWNIVTPTVLLSSARARVSPVYRNPGYGFRCVLALSAAPAAP